MKGSILITSCDCVKRNGLQWECPRSECMGRPCCTTKPIPSCCPSKYAWRYANVTMGKRSNPVNPNKCRVKNDGCGCNPCVVDCSPCPMPCDDPCADLSCYPC